MRERPNLCITRVTSVQRPILLTPLPFSLLGPTTMSIPMSSPPKVLVLRNIQNREIKVGDQADEKLSVATTTSHSAEHATSLKKQKRLLLLYHASTCRHEDCREFEHCMAMKRLFRHITLCRYRQCDVPSCRKNRHVWKHYETCVDDKCFICAPVKNYVQR